jgi:hypothetical protein
VLENHPVEQTANHPFFLGVETGDGLELPQRAGGTFERASEAENRAGVEPAQRGWGCRQGRKTG